MYVTPIYAALAALLFSRLSVRALSLRRRLGVPIGDGGNPEILRAMRVHANFAEYTPITLLMIFMLELSGGPPPLIHALGLSLLAGRLSHAMGVSQVDEDYRYRVVGMAMTFTPLICAAVGILVRTGMQLAGL
jgi:uncharacterized membrane protein YecN with MAPEG domain